MKLKAFALLDMKVGAFGTPFFMAHLGQAIRAVTDLCQDLSTTPGRYPADFALCEIGEYDDNTGVLSAMNIQNHGVLQGFLPPKVEKLFSPAQGDVVPMLEVARSNGVAPHSDERN